jgi:hypothetical protein
MIMRAKIVTCLILCLFLFLASLNSVHATVTGTFHFRGYFDGSDYVYIQDAGGKVWYEHIAYDYPGEHSPYSSSSPAATTIDGVDWYPTWNKTTKMSGTYVSSSPQNYPSGEWAALNITKITNASDSTQSRGPITIEDFPSSSNNYTAKVLVNDDTGSIVYSGAAWYEFELSWNAPQLVPEYPFGIVEGLFTLLPVALAIFLSKRRRRAHL